MQRFYLIVMCVLFSSHIHAEEEPKKKNPLLGIELRGNLDFYYQMSPQGHSTSPEKVRYVEGRVFDRTTNQMTLSLAELSLLKESGRVTYRIDFASGYLIDQISEDKDPTKNVTQAYVSFKATERLELTFGKFYTNIGHEGVHAQDNWNYSRSYLFNYGPFWHQGMVIDYKLVPEKLNASLYIINSWDGRLSQEKNQDLSLSLKLNYIVSDQLTVTYNYIGGKESEFTGRRQLNEIILSYNFSDKHSLALDAQYGANNNVPGAGTTHWGGVAIYYKAQITDLYYLASRFEVFDDPHGFSIPGALNTTHPNAQTISALTLTNNFNLGEGLELRAEVRLDQSSSRKFFRLENGKEIKNQESLTLACLYAF